MKELFDEEAFDRSVRSRLENFESEPDNHIKRNILSKVGNKGSFTGRIISGVVILILLTSFFFGYEYLFETEDSVENLSNVDEVSSFPESPTGDKSKKPELIISGKTNAPDAISPVEDLQSEILNDISVQRNIDYAKGDLSSPMSAQNPIGGTKSTGVAEREELLYMENIPLSMPANEIDFPAIQTSENKNEFKEKQELIKTRNNGKWGVYGDMLTFWTYQHATPNKNDEWIVNQMENPGLLSSDRMGGRISGGLYYELTDAMELFGGFSVQLQQFQTAFQVRSLKASNFSYHEDINAFIPTYEFDRIIVDQKLWSGGIKAGFRYYLPYGKKNFWFSSSLDYQKMITEVVVSNYSFPENQIYLNAGFGWRTKIARQLYFNISPSLSYSLVQRSNYEEVVSIIPFSWGINMGLNYRFQR